MTKSDIDDLIETVQKLRIEKYPDIPAALVNKIIEAEAKFIDNRVEASRNVAAIIDDYFGEEG